MRIGSRAALAAVLIICAGSVQAGPEDEVKAQFSKFIAAQNAHDLKAVGDMLLDSPQFREAALKRFEALYQGTWSLDPKTNELKVFEVQPGVAQLYVPITFMIAPAGQTAQPIRFLMNQILVKTAEGWKVSSVLPIPVPMQ
jgi:hypothetical protein